MFPDLPGILFRLKGQRRSFRNNRGDGGRVGDFLTEPFLERTVTGFIRVNRGPLCRALYRASRANVQWSVIVSLYYLCFCAADRDNCTADSLSVHCFFAHNVLLGKHFQLFFSKSRNRSSSTAPKDGRFHCPCMRLQLSTSPALFWWETEKVPTSCNQ